jgi:hypothetical protein
MTVRRADRQKACRGHGSEDAHIAIVDNSRLSYVEVLPDEKPEHPFVASSPDPGRLCTLGHAAHDRA